MQSKRSAVPRNARRQACRHLRAMLRAVKPRYRHRRACAIRPAIAATDRLHFRQLALAPVTDQERYFRQLAPGEIDIQFTSCRKCCARAALLQHFGNSITPAPARQVASVVR